MHIYPVAHDHDRAVFVPAGDLALLGGDVSDAVAVAEFLTLPQDDKEALAALSDEDRQVGYYSLEVSSKLGGVKPVSSVMHFGRNPDPVTV